MNKIKNIKQGFTLLELLVVVSIIGILAAIALPKYQLVVYKAKYTQMVNMVRALGNAEEEYYLTHNSYTDDLNALSVSLPEGLRYDEETNRYFIGDCGITVHPTKYVLGVLFKGGEMVASYTFYYQFSSMNDRFKSQTRCITYAANKELGKKICESLGGELISNKHDTCGTTGNTQCNLYILYRH